MVKLLLFVFVLSLVLLGIASVAAEPQNLVDATNTQNNLQTNVQVDSLGDIHVLWIVPPLNGSASGPGIWYGKYAPNGTKSIPPTQVSNSTTISSADMTADSKGNAVIVWADTPGVTVSTLYLQTFNSTNSTTAQILSTKDSLILWPSIAEDNNDTIHLTWTQYFPHVNRAIVEYGTVLKHRFTRSEAIASYTGVSVFPPKARIVFDNSTEHIQIAWGETHSANQPNSTVDYAKLVTNGTVLTRLQVAKFNATLRDLAISASQGGDGAFVLWQTDSSDQSVFVSQISSSGQLRFLKQLNEPSSQLKYLAVSTDSQDNLYVVSYQPFSPSLSPAQTPPPATTITYVRMNQDGDIVETWNSMVRTPIISAAVSGTGNVYALSPSGLVRVAVPTESYAAAWFLALFLAGCISAASAFSTEEGRYRLIAFSSRRTSTVIPQQSTQIVNMLAKKPGLNLQDLQHHAQSTNMRLLVRMEKSGTLGSFRDGLSRRFYVKPRTATPIDTVATRVLHWVLDHPDTWEAQLSKDLGLSQQIVHYHLKKLREAGLITATGGSNGSRKLYRFTNAR
jgi:DNA-binding transcriptional ArsR family regulator